MIEYSPVIPIAPSTCLASRAMFNAISTLLRLHIEICAVVALPSFLNTPSLHVKNCALVISVIMSVNNSLVCWGIEKYGSEEHKLTYLNKLATGKIIGAFCLSEPEAGSDATSQKTTAIDMGDHYLLNGTKNWITNGNSASVYLVIAQTDIEKGHRGINAFIVEKDYSGVTVGPKENKLGIRSSDTTSIMFSDVKVPKKKSNWGKWLWL